MKKSTCKTLLWIGIIFVVLGTLVMASQTSKYNPPDSIMIPFSSIFLIGIILLIISWISWNSEKREKEREELRQAQLEAVRKGKVNVEIKGKMRKLG